MTTTDTTDVSACALVQAAREANRQADPAEGAHLFTVEDWARSSSLAAMNSILAKALRSLSDAGGGPDR